MTTMLMPIKKIFFSCVFLGILAIPVFWWILERGDTQMVKNTPLQGEVIVAFGDSLVFGTGSQKGGGFVSYLSDLLGKEIVNVGIPGNTTSDGLARLESDVLSKKPDLVLVLLGGNDVLKRVPKEETFKNLLSIVTQIQEAGATTVVLGVRSGILQDTYESEYAKIAKETGSIYVPDVLNDVFGDSRYMSDTIHPNDAGYEIIARRVFDKITFLFPDES